MAVAVPYQNTPGTNKPIKGMKAKIREITATQRAPRAAFMAVGKLSTAEEAKRQKIRGYRYLSTTLIPKLKEGE